MFSDSKILLLSLLLILFCSADIARAQSQWRIEQQFRPEHSYTISNLIKHNSQMGADGDEVMQEALSQVNPDWGKTSLDSSFSLFKVVTGKAISDTSIPFVLTVDSMDVTRSRPYDLTDITVYGTTTPTGPPQIDSIIGLTEDQLYKQATSAMIGSSFGTVDFPEHPLVVGDTFSDTDFFPLQVGGIQLSVAVRSHYTLENVQGDEAHFSLRRFYDMQSDGAQYGVTAYAHGNGSGTITFDLGQSFVTEQTSTSRVEIKMQLQALDISIIRETTNLQIVHIEDDNQND